MKFTRRTYRAARRRALRAVLQAKQQHDWYMSGVLWGTQSQHPDARAHRETITTARERKLAQLKTAIAHAEGIVRRARRERGMWR